MKVVLDTNIVVSAALTPEGNSAKIIDLLTSHQDIQLSYSTEILTEYEDVLSRPRLNIKTEMRIRVINLLKNIGILIEPMPSNILFSDENDRIFYDTARAAEAILVTGNQKHYPIEPFIMSPANFLKMTEKAL